MNTTTMTDTDDTDAQVKRLRAETAKLEAEARKLDAENHKLAAEREKLFYEALKFKAESTWGALALPAGIGAVVAGILVAFATYFRH